MANPLGMLRMPRSRKPVAVGRCAVCRDDVVEGVPALHVHGVHVHKSCASYRMRQRARLR